MTPLVREIKREKLKMNGDGANVSKEEKLLSLLPSSSSSAATAAEKRQKGKFIENVRQAIVYFSRE